MSALFIGYNPDLWEPTVNDGDEFAGLTAWPMSQNAYSITNEMLPGTPFILVNQKTHDVVEMGTLAWPVNLGNDMGWESCADNWTEAGWKVCPTDASSSFGTGGCWMPLAPIGLESLPDLWFPCPDRALQERNEQRLYRRNPQAVLSDKAYAECRHALMRSMTRHVSAAV